MNLRTLITHSPYLLSVLVVLGLAAPHIVMAQGADSVIKGLIYFIIVNFTGWLVYIGAAVLDFAINEFVIEFGKFVTTSGVGVAIDELWVIIRDFFNILFIFGLVYIGFKMILNSDDARTRGTLVSLIMAALLVNFSLLATKMVVDFSNILATEIACSTFTLEKNGTPLTGANLASANCLDEDISVDVSSSFFSSMGLQEGLFLSKEISTATNESWAFIFGSAMVNIVGAFVFFAGGIMLIIRFVTLSIYLVMSPLMFVGWVFPGLGGETMKKYWGGFLGRAFYAPVYILLLFFAINIIQQLSGPGGIMNELVDDPSLANGVTFGTFLAPFILTSAFMIAAVQVAGKLSADGAGAAMNAGRNLANRGRKAATYLPRRLGSKGVGIAANQWDKRIEQSDSKASRFTRKLVTTATLGLVDDRQRQSMIKAGKNAKFGTSYSHADDIENKQTQKQISSRRTQRSEDESAIKAAEGIDVNTNDDDLKKKLDAAELAANRYTQDELEKMNATQRDNIVKHLKANSVAKLLDSDKLSVDDKAGVHGNYKDAIEKQVLANGELVTEELTKLSGKQLEVLGADFIEKYADSFTDSQMDDIRKSDGFTERQKDGFKETRKSKRKTAAADPAQRTRLFNGTQATINPVTGDRIALPSAKPIKATEIANLPFDAFVQGGILTPEAMRAMNADILKQIARNANQGKSSMTDPEREMLGRLVKGAASVGAFGTPSVATYINSVKGKEDYFLT